MASAAADAAAAAAIACRATAVDLTGGRLVAASTATAIAAATKASCRAATCCADDDPGTSGLAAAVGALRSRSDAAATAARDVGSTDMTAGAAKTAASARVAVTATGAANGAVIDKIDIDQIDIAGDRIGVSARIVGDEQAAAETGATAAAGRTSAADGVHVCKRQVLDRDIAGIDEQAAMAADAVDSTAVEGRAIAVDGERHACTQIDRGRIRRLGFVAVELDNKVAGGLRIHRSDGAAQIVERDNVCAAMAVALDQENLRRAAKGERLGGRTVADSQRAAREADGLAARKSKPAEIDGVAGSKIADRVGKRAARRHRIELQRQIAAAEADPACAARARGREFERAAGNRGAAAIAVRAARSD